MDTSFKKYVTGVCQLKAATTFNKSDIFSYNIFVTFYKKEADGIEHYLGNGLVTNIQNNGLIQVTVNNWDISERSFNQQIISGNKYDWNKVILKPYIEQQKISDILGEI